MLNNNFNNDSTPKKKNSSKAIIYVLIAILLTTVGGIASSICTIKYLKKNPEIITGPKATQENNIPNTTNNNSTTKKLNSMNISDVAKKVGPSVVGVSTKGFPKSVGFGFEVEGQEGLGSGIIFDKEGYILTNNHVIQGAKTIRVIFNNGKEAAAKLINSDPQYDVAVIKITEKIDIPGIADFGDSDTLTVGETAIAIGNPLGKELLGSVTSGVISAINRTIDERNKNLKLIQTDAAINPGNSGGPLVNSKGQVIGINTEKRVGRGVEGLGFAIPINQIKPKIKNLMTPKVMLGIMGRTVTKEDSKYYNIPTGAFVTDVMKYSPAEKSGLNAGDIIIEVNGKTISSMEDLDKIKQKHKAGEILNLKVYRDKKKVNIKLTLEAY